MIVSSLNHRNVNKSMSKITYFSSSDEAQAKREQQTTDISSSNVFVSPINVWSHGVK